jgi:hypothetical protein
MDSGRSCGALDTINLNALAGKAAITLSRSCVCPAQAGQEGGEVLRAKCIGRMNGRWGIGEKKKL